MPSLLRRLSDVSWRVLVIGVTVVAATALLWRLRVVLLSLLVALLITTALVPLVTRLEQRGWKPLLATWTVFLGFLAVIAGVVALIAPAVASEFEGLGETVGEGVDDVEEWLVDGPLELERADIDRLREEAGENVRQFLRSSSSSIVSGAVAVVEAVAGSLLALVLAFLFVKDGRRFQRWSLDHLPLRHHDVIRACARGAFAALGGYLRASATLGLIEGSIMAVTLWIVGAHLAIPVAVITLAAAFFPIVGAVMAGAVAVLVALVSAGPGAALIVLAVAIAVQQLDNDILAPFIFGRAVHLHPAVILVSLAAGGTLGGITGAFLAVPVAAVASAVFGELWRRHGEAWRTRDASADTG